MSSWRIQLRRQAGLRDPEDVRDLRDRLLAGPGELDTTSTERRRPGGGHVGLLSETIIASGRVSGIAGRAPTVHLNFLGRSWPQVTVTTLTKVS
jgi:hypothetical protein